MRSRAALPSLLSLISAVSCAEPEPASEPQTSLFRTMRFARELEEGQSHGFDLDGQTTAEGEGTGCGVADFTGPGGEVGIDNEFARILPAIEELGGAALELLVQDAIEAGELLLLTELQGLDAEDEDPCVDLSLMRGTGVPAVGGDGLILAGQSFERSEIVEPSSVKCQALENGVLRAAPLTMRLPLAVFDEIIDLTMHDGVIELRKSEAGWDVTIGGGVDVAEIQHNVDGFDGIGDDIPVLVETVLGLHADLSGAGPGACDRISVTLQAEAVPAFLIDAN